MTRIAVCIATLDRPGLLATTLAALESQTEPPAEIIVADASRVTPWTHRLGGISSSIVRLTTTETALPRLRRLAWQAATAELLLFLDDDVTLDPSALERLRATWEGLRASSAEPPAGVGLLKVWDDGELPVRDRAALHERWLGMHRLPSGSLTPGGLSVTHDGLPVPGTHRVAHLWGGAMAYPREVLHRIGPLQHLEALYTAGLGRGEDVVLSRQAARFGSLWILAEPLARHRRTLGDEPTPYARSGWRQGRTATWGRAQTLPWVAPEQGAVWGDWARVASLEVVRSAWAVLRRPWQPGRWARIGGAVLGSGQALLTWHRRPRSPAVDT